MIAIASSGGKKLGVFTLTMINIMAVASLRTLPFSAEYGFSLLFYYLVATITFFIPIALISAELSTAWPSRGGAYIWVREAFGDRWAFLTIWMQWIFNLIWFPTILVFIVETGLSIFFPNWAQHHGLILALVLGLFWGATWLNCFGMQFSAAFSAFSAIVGTLIPLGLIIGLGMTWLWQDQPIATPIGLQYFWPQSGHGQNLAFFSTILFGLLGIEMSAVHADDIATPGKTYPKAILLSTGIILGSLILGSLAIAITVPNHNLNVINGLTQAFATMLDNQHLNWLLPLVGIMIILSGLGNVSAWIIGPTKGILIAAQDGNLPTSWSYTNQHKVPVTILFIQGMIFTGLCSVLILMPSIESGYWVLTAMTAQMGLAYYAILFATGLKLRQKYPHQPRAFQIPGGKIGMRLIAGMGLTCCIIAISLGFLPPERIAVGALWRYEGFLLGGIVLMLLPPVITILYKTTPE